MREMKDSGIEWIGRIPENWNIQRLRFLCSITTGNMDTQDNNPDGEYPFYVRSPIVEHSEKYTFDNEAVLMAGDGVGAGKVFHYVNGKYGCHQRVYSMSGFSIVNGKYLFYYLRENFRKKIEESNAKSTVDSVRLPMLKDFPVAFPTKQEQRLIVNYLDSKCSKIDEIIAKQEKIIEKLKEYKLSVITEAVTRGLNPDVEMKDSGDSEIGLIPKNSVVMKLKYLCNTQGRIGFKGYTTADLVDEGEGAITLGASHMNNGLIDLTNPVYISWEKYYESPEIMVNQGDVLIVQRGSTIGKTAIVDKDYGKVTINPSLVLMNKIRINNKYLLYALSARYIVNQIELIGTNTAIPMISQKQINELKVVVPLEEEQNQIKEYLDSICSDVDYKISKLETIILKLQEYKKSLIYEVVTGKKEV